MFEEGDNLECGRLITLNKYRPMDCPFKKQKLHLLYPGRFLSQEYEPDGYNIPHSDPENLEKSRKMSKSLQAAYNMEKEALSRHLGGDYKVYPFPAVEPEAIIDDPGLRGLDIEILNEKHYTTKYENGNTSNNPLNNLNIMVKDRNEIVDYARDNDENTSYETILDDNQKLPEYDWEDVVEKEYPRVKIDSHLSTAYIDSKEKQIADELNGNYFRENYKYIDMNNYFSGNSNLKYIGITMCIILLLLLIIVVCMAVIYY